ncbi:MAG: ABC transporter substrate-binding protein, partial [Thermomicrobiales bacterium]
MTTRNTRPSPSPSVVGYMLSRRGVVKGAVGAAALGLGLPAGLARAQVEPGTASGELTVGSNYSNELPREGLHTALDAFPNENVTIALNEVDHNTFQENITTYLQNPDDVIPWFAGYRMQFFAAQDLLGPIDDVWAAGLNDTMSEGFKLASTGQDGLLYFVPITYYCWGIHYRPSLFEENGWTPPTTWEEAKALGAEAKKAGKYLFLWGTEAATYYQT